MTQKVFIDTSFFIAVLNKSDEFHADAKRIYEKIINEKWNCVITDSILIETGNYFSNPGWREIYSNWIDFIINKKEIFQIIPFDIKTFYATIDYFKRFSDKDWSMIDCISFVTMRKYKISEVLTFDHHFVQAGFTNLIKNL